MTTLDGDRILGWKQHKVFLLRTTRDLTGQEFRNAICYSNGKEYKSHKALTEFFATIGFEALRQLRAEGKIK